MFVKSVSPSGVRALTFESLHLETSFLVRRYTFRISRSYLYIKVIGSRSRSRSNEQQGHMSTTKYTHSRVVRLQLNKGNLVAFTF